MSFKTVKFKEAFALRTIEVCKDELEFHIHEADYPHEYHDAICVKTGLLFNLGEEDIALEYLKGYIKALSMEIKDETDFEYRLDLETMKHHIQGMYKALDHSRRVAK